MYQKLLCLRVLFEDENLEPVWMTKQKESANMSKNFYSREAFYQQRLQDFISFGERKTQTHTLFDSYPTEINDGPKDEPLGVRLKLPPFKGWKDLDL